jgi:rare lipoprotein A
MRSLFAAVLAAFALAGGASLSAEAFTGANSRQAVAGHEAAGASHLQLARAVVGPMEGHRGGAKPTDRSATEGRLDRPRHGKPRHLGSARGTGVRAPRHAARHGRVAPRTAQRTRRGAVRSARRTNGVQDAAAGTGTTGMASFYWQGHTTASGAHFNPEGMTAAHRSLPFGTRVRVTHLGNGRTVEVRINDRGPFIGGRIIDLSRGAAGVLGMHGQGVARVQVTVLGR